MAQADATFAWHLKRGQEIYSPISHRELRLLAEFGHLRPDDLLWRAGLGSWRSPSSVPGIALQQGGLTSLGRQFLSRLRAVSLAARNALRQRTLVARRQARSVKGRLQHTYNRAVSGWPNFNLVKAVRRRPHQSVLAGLVVIAVAVTAVDLATQSTFATGGNAQLAKSDSSKFQDRASTERAAPLWTKPKDSQPATAVSEAKVFSVSNSHPTGGFVIASTATSVSQQAQPYTEPTQSPVFQSETAETSGDVPLPTKKPDKPSVKAQANTATLRRTAQRPKGKEPRPMQFGTIGYNYVPQR